MASDAIFRVAADMAEYIAGMDRADRATKKVARSAGDIGGQITGSLIKVELLNRALNATGRAISDVLNKAQSASKTAGDRAIDVATSLSGLGVRDINAVTRRLSVGSGVTTPEQGAQFARALLSSNRQRRAPLSGAQNEQAIEAFLQFGEFGFGAGGEDLLTGLAEGQSLERLTQRAAIRAGRVRTAMTDPASPLFQGVRGRGAETSAQLEEERAFLASGTSERVNRAEARIAAARDPGGPVSIVSGAVGENAGTFVNRAMQSLVGGGGQAERAGENATTSLNRSISGLSVEIRKMVNQPNFATDTR